MKWEIEKKEFLSDYEKLIKKYSGKISYNDLELAFQYLREKRKMGLLMVGEKEEDINDFLMCHVGEENKETKT